MSVYDATEYFLFKHRDKVLLMLISALFLLIASRLVYLQVFRHDYYFTLSESNRIRILPIPSARGRIMDRNGTVLVDNSPTYTISIMPFEFPADSALVKKLANLLQIPAQSIWEKYEKTRNIQYLPVKLKKRATFDLVSEIEEKAGEFPGVIYQVEPVRSYPLGKIAPHILGYTGEVSAAELRERYREGIKAGDVVGKQGVERYFDNILRGKSGASYLEVRANGEVVGPVEGYPDISPINGADIILTIDTDLQQYLESISRWMPKGAIVVLNPQNGDVLAATSVPDFDQTIFSKPISDSVWATLNDPEVHPLLCRWYQGTYPPASPIKILSSAAGIDENITSASSYMELPCLGAMQYGDRWFFCWLRSGHKHLDLLEAIAQSCDIYFYQIGARLGLDTWSDYTKKCFFGQPTGIELPHEASGLVPDRQYYNLRYGRRGWGAGVALNLVIGQGELLTTPLQMAQFTAAIANGGTVWKPRIIKEIHPPMKHRLIFQPIRRGKLPFSKQAIKTVVDGMVRVCNEKWATGYSAHMDDILVAGKTGTAQNPHGADHAWFISFAPADKPEVVIVILVEAGGSGGAWAWLARLFYEYYFYYWKFEHT